LTQIAPISEKIIERKVIVYKTLVDPTAVKLAGEKLKEKVFVKFGFMKPKPEEIRCVSIDKYYEPYLVLDGKYAIDYYRKRVYTLEVDENVQEVIVLDKTFKPEPPKEPLKRSYKAVQLDGKERLFYESKAYLILDKAGREVGPELVPSAPSEEHPDQILADLGQKVRNFEMAPDKEVELLRSKVVKRPSDIGQVVKESFEVSERAIIYTPVYEIVFENTKSGEKKTVKMDGVTSKIFS